MPITNNTHMTSILSGGRGIKQKWDIRHKRVGGSECFGCPIFIFLIEKIGFAPWLEIMLSQTIYYWQIFLSTLVSESKPNDSSALLMG